ncbi:MAG TPA: hypothetical protein VK841_09400 [Polyangiaceae bacterium]|jgi:hypothetical protein|nr:hypothetical protein [Polyangiaceae bacterium]
MFDASLDLDDFYARAAATESLIRHGLGPAAMDAAAEGAGEAIRVHHYQDRHPGTGLTSRIFAKMTARTGDSAEAEIIADKPYAAYVENGTRPHVIEAKRAQALRWEDSGGGVHFAKRVNHPGTTPRPFMGPAYIHTEQILERNLLMLAERARVVLEGDSE